MREGGFVLRLLLVLTLSFMFTSCSEEKPIFETSLSPVHTDLTHMKDSNGRYVHFRGTNVGGSTKVPVYEPMLDVPLGKARGFSYVGRPFAPGEEDQWFGQLRELGFNSIRLLFMWEAVFPDKKGEPDQEFLDYFRLIVEKSNEYGIYVLFNMHENLWSRHLFSSYNENINSTCNEDTALCLDDILLPMVPPYTDKVAGDGAPLWATKVALPEKQNFGGKQWGMYHVLGRLNDPLVDSLGLAQLKETLKNNYDMDVDDLINTMRDNVAEELKDEDSNTFTVRETCDMLPWTFWGVNNAISLDIEKAYAGFFAGNIVFPTRRVDFDTDGNEIVTMLLKAADLLKQEEKINNDEEIAEADKAKAFTDWLSENHPSEQLYYLTGSDSELNKLPELPENIVVKEQSYVDELYTVENYLQEGFTEAWIEIAKIGKDYPNVIGYDIMNEPASLFILLTVAQVYFDLGLDDTVGGLLHDLLVGDKDPADHNDGDDIWDLIGLLEILPPVHMAKKGLLGGKTVEGVKYDWGFTGADLFAMAGLNTGFGKNHLTPLFEKVGAAIMDVYMEEYKDDYDRHRPIIYLEPAGSIDNFIGGEGGGLGGQWQSYMVKPRFAEKYQPVPIVWAPHWYPDIYPNIGFNQKPRMFNEYEYKHRDYRETLAEKAHYAEFALDNSPVVFGEFGTYWNYRYATCDAPTAENDYNPEYNPDNCSYYADDERPENEPIDYSDPDKERPGYEQSRYYNYSISSEIMDNYYEAFESLFMSNINWCYTTDNDPVYGDWWDHEDFSIIDENGEARGAMAWVRPYPRALSGKPISMHFYSDYHYFDPDKGEPNATREFELVFASKETDAPTLIFVPKLQYPDGFYVWLSDGWAAFDETSQVLYYHPANDETDWEHKVVIRPPTEGQDITGWKYFVKGSQVVTANGSSLR